MEASEALSTAAQIAVAIAGFAGVVVVFRNESVYQWGPVDKFRLRLLLINSMLPLTFCMVGLLLLAIKPFPPATWRWCSGFAAVVLFPYAAIILKALFRFAPGQLEAAGGGKFTSYPLLAIGIAVSLLQVYNVTTLNAFWPFFAAIVSLLWGAMVQFVRLVLVQRQSGT
jgi:hypothetical protein